MPSRDVMPTLLASGERLLLLFLERVDNTFA